MQAAVWQVQSMLMQLYAVHEMQNRYIGYKSVFIGCFQINDVVGLIYKLRHSRLAADMLESTSYSLIRLLITHSDIDHLLSILDDTVCWFCAGRTCKFAYYGNYDWCLRSITVSFSTSTQLVYLSTHYLRVAMCKVKYHRLLSNDLLYF
jgi:hypothetical protein